MWLKEYKWEKVEGEFKEKLNWESKPGVHLILTEENFYLECDNVSWKIVRKEYFTYDIVDNMYGTTMILRDIKDNTLSISCSDRIQYLNLFNFLDRIEKD